MLNPIDTTTVIRDSQVTGTIPDQIHPGVAWWVGACLVLTTQTSSLALAHDGHATSTEFARRLGRGAINAQHYQCQVADLGTADETQLRRAATSLGGAPAVLVTTAGQTVTMHLYGPDGQPLDESGLAAIRRLIDADRVPIPVNDQNQGQVIDRRDLLTAQRAAA